MHVLPEHTWVDRFDAPVYCSVVHVNQPVYTLQQQADLQRQSYN